MDIFYLHLNQTQNNDKNSCLMQQNEINGTRHGQEN